MINKQQIVELRNKGLTQQQISELLGCNASYVWLVLKEMGLTESKMSMTSIERLERRLKPNDESNCWEFQGAKTNDGYGQIKIDGINHRAHRLAYSLYVGEIPEGMLVCHRCDNPPCCNPDHLFLGSDADNTSDKVAKERVPKGLELPQTKMTEDLRIQIKQLKSQGLSNRAIGFQLGISHVTVSRNSHG